MKIIDFYKKMRTGSLICLLVRKCLCVSVSRGKPSIYFLLNIGYPLRPSRRVPSCPVVVVVVVVLCPSVRPVVRPVVVVRPLSVRPRPSVVVVRPLSVRPSRRPSRRRRPSSVRPSRRPSKDYCELYKHTVLYTDTDE